MEHLSIRSEHIDKLRLASRQSMFSMARYATAYLRRHRGRAKQAESPTQIIALIYKLFTNMYNVTKELFSRQSRIKLKNKTRVDAMNIKRSIDESSYSLAKR